MRRPVDVRRVGVAVAALSALLFALPACTGPAVLARRVAWLAPPTADTAARGVLVTPTGVVVPILAADAGGAWVRTPCFRTAWVRRGVRIDDTDVVLDPGHGGPELGAVGPNGLEEKVPNLAIAQLVGTELQGDGQRVVFTRMGDSYYLTIRTRAEIVRALGPKVVISIHHNSVGPDPRNGRPGTQVFHQSESARSRHLADLVADEILDAFAFYDIAWVSDEGPTTRTRTSEESGRDYYGLLRYGTAPTVIAESAYISNAAEADLLATAGFRAVEAAAIVRGVRAYLRDEVKQSNTSEPSVNDEPLPTSAPADAADCVDPRLA